MALVSHVLQTWGLVFFLIFHVHAAAIRTSGVKIQSLEVGNLTCDINICKYVVKVNGGKFLGHYPWRLTAEEGAKGDSCDLIYPNYEIKEIETSKWFSTLEVSVPNVDGKIYFCLIKKSTDTLFGDRWVHQGVEHFLEPKNDVATHKEKISITAEPKSESQGPNADKNPSLDDEADNTQRVNTKWTDLTHDIDVNYLPSIQRPEREEKNDIKVMYHEKNVRINDLIEQIKIDSKQSVDGLHDLHRNVNINIKGNVIKNNFEGNIQKDSNPENPTFDKGMASAPNTMSSPEMQIIMEDFRNQGDKVKHFSLEDVKHNGAKLINDKEFDELVFKFQLSMDKVETIMAEMVDPSNEINGVPNTLYSAESSLKNRIEEMKNLRNEIMRVMYNDVKYFDTKYMNQTKFFAITSSALQKVRNKRQNAKNFTMNSVKLDKVKYYNETDLDDFVSDILLSTGRMETYTAEVLEAMNKLNAILNNTPSSEISLQDSLKELNDARSQIENIIFQYQNHNYSKDMNDTGFDTVISSFLQDMRNQRNDEENLNVTDEKFTEVKPLNYTEFDDLVSKYQFSKGKVETIMAELEDPGNEINAVPNTTFSAVTSLLKCIEEMRKLRTEFENEIRDVKYNAKYRNRKDFHTISSPSLQKVRKQRNNVKGNYMNNKKDNVKFFDNTEFDNFMSDIQSSTDKMETLKTEMFETVDELNKMPFPERSLQESLNELDDVVNEIKNSLPKQFDIASSGSIDVTPEMTSDVFFREEDKVVPKVRKRRQAFPEDDFRSVSAVNRRIIIEGLRIEDSEKEPKIIEDGIPSVLAESAVTLRVYGDGLTPRTVIAFTHDAQPYGQPCKFLLKGEYMVKEGSLQARTALFEIRTPAPIVGSKLYICAKNLLPGAANPKDDEEKYLHQGTETWKMIASHNKLLPLWVSIMLILFCLMFSALFSGLNLGLMSLDRTELKIIANTGTDQERKYARAIMPVRDHGNYLLCSILLGNVAVNSTFTILLDELTSGLFAVIFSTLAIVLLGEITPQAICSRHGLMVGAKSIMVTKGVMAVTAPLSFPVSKLLDYFLGEEIGNVYNRERLKELVKVTTDVNDLDKDEVNIISGALEMRKKTVKDVMTKLEDVFMLPISSVLDFETMSEIVKSGYSRIPVYEGGRGNIVTVLFIKDLAFVDPDDNTPLRTLCQYYQNPAHFVFEDVTLDVIFKQFKDGHKGHMAFVHRINSEGEGDPFYETIGLVTLEDVIEEMIQAEIVDETDVFLDNRSKRRRRPQNKLQDFAAFAERHENQRIHISPQLTLATFQFLSTSVDAFRPDTVSETVLRRLLKQDVIQYIKMKGKTKKDPSSFVYQQGKPVDYFVLILEGRVEVTVGRENLVFEAGPFTYFGVQALTQNVGVAESPTPSAMGSLQNINMDAMLRHTFVPDYSVTAITSLYYLTVKRSLYLAAKRATLMEKGNISKGGTTQEFDTEVDKLLQSVDEDLSITGEHKTPSRQISPHPMPVSPAPRSLDARNGHAYVPTSSDEQERLLK